MSLGIFIKPGCLLRRGRRLITTPLIFSDSGEVHTLVVNPRSFSFAWATLCSNVGGHKSYASFKLIADKNRLSAYYRWYELKDAVGKFDCQLICSKLKSKFKLLVLKVGNGKKSIWYVKYWGRQESKFEFLM